MALEPLGAVANAAGLMDLGMTICQNLLKYYQSRKEAENNIRKTYISIENLERSFSILARLMSQACFDEDVLFHVQQTVINCQDGINCLQRKLTKITSQSDCNDGRRWQADLRRQLELTLYPFRESTLVKLKEVCNAMQENLNTALHLLQIDVSTSSSRTIEGISGHIRGLSSAVSEMNNNIECSKETLSGLDKLHKGEPLETQATDAAVELS